jgi:hypothetical protein
MTIRTSSRRALPRAQVIGIRILIIVYVVGRLCRVVFFTDHLFLYQLPQAAVVARAANETNPVDALPFFSQPPAVSNTEVVNMLEQAPDQSQLFFSPSIMDTSASSSSNQPKPEPSFPAPPSARENEPSSFSACLLVMDDNHRLSEWLAYHYFVLPLRHVVIAVDPSSRTFPYSILDRWRPYMNVTIWNDADFGVNMMGENAEAILVKTSQHRTRQRHFYKHCTAHLRKLNQTWTTYHDIDEFVAINSNNLLVNNSDTRMGQSGSILSLLQDLRIQQPATPLWSGACITLPRILYSALESTEAQRQRKVPSLVDAGQYETLRWRYRTSDRDSHNNLKAKAIMDVSRVPVNIQRFEVHRPIKSICPPATVTMRVSPIIVHHYLGSWESYSYRDDARKGNEKNRLIWDYRSTLQDGGANDEVRPWIQGFVRLVGEDAACQLLRDVGLPVNYTAAASVEATWDAKGAWKEESGFGKQNAGFAAFLQHRMANTTRYTKNATQLKT